MLYFKYLVSVGMIEIGNHLVNDVLIGHTIHVHVDMLRIPADAHISSISTFARAGVIVTDKAIDRIVKPYDLIGRSFVDG